MTPEAIAIIVAVLTATPLGLLGWSLRGFRKEWQASWHGHRVVVRNYLTREQLFIDGKLVAQAAGSHMRSTLVGSIEDGGRGVPVLASLGGAFTAKCEIFIDGESVALATGRIGEFVPLGGAAMPSSLPTSAAEPKDARWKAVGTLLRAIRSHLGAGDDDLRNLCQRAEQRLRWLLLELEGLAEAIRAHQALSDQTGAPELRDVLAARETEAKALVAAIQRLHIGVIGGGAADAADTSSVRQLLSQLIAEAEVAAVRDETPQRIAAARAAAAAASAKNR